MSPPFPGKNAATKNPYIGSFAVQLMNGISMIVIFLSRSDGRVLDDITAGTEHPNPTSIGTIDRPESPIFRRGLSITKAIRAIYPVSSSSDRKKKSTTMIGRKLITEPTPANTPSITSECRTGLTFQAVIPLSSAPASASIPICIRFWKNAPITLKVSQNTSAIIPINAGIAVYLPVRILSIFRLLSCSFDSFGFMTVCDTSFSIKAKRISAMAAERSRPLSSSICTMICSIMSFSFCSRSRACVICSSPSMSFVAAKRSGISALVA